MRRSLRDRGMLRPDRDLLITPIRRDTVSSGAFNPNVPVVSIRTANPAPLTCPGARRHIGMAPPTRCKCRRDSVYYGFPVPHDFVNPGKNPHLRQCLIPGCPIIFIQADLINTTSLARRRHLQPIEALVRHLSFDQRSPWQLWIQVQIARCGRSGLRILRAFSGSLCKEFAFLRPPSRLE